MSVGVMSSRVEDARRVFEVPVVPALVVNAVVDADAATIDGALLEEMGSRRWTPLRSLYVVTPAGELVAL